ncbi:MAG: hypothetical protein RIR52_1648, partial [Acidobacteriota bacterium]
MKGSVAGEVTGKKELVLTIPFEGKTEAVFEGDEGLPAEPVADQFR